VPRVKRGQGLVAGPDSPYRHRRQIVNRAPVRATETNAVILQGPQAERVDGVKRAILPAAISDRTASRWLAERLKGRAVQSESSYRGDEVAGPFGGRER
jgi:hypothetical protein